MKRPIIFRGKSLNTKNFVFGDLLQKGKRCFIEYEVDSETIGQYSGLRDMTNQKIYEGDILIDYRKEYLKNWECKFTNGSFNFFNKSTIMRNTNTDTMKIIGNIYDNIELLNN